MHAIGSAFLQTAAGAALWRRSFSLLVSLIAPGAGCAQSEAFWADQPGSIEAHDLCSSGSGSGEQRWLSRLLASSTVGMKAAAKLARDTAWDRLEQSAGWDSITAAAQAEAVAAALQRPEHQTRCKVHSLPECLQFSVGGWCTHNQAQLQEQYSSLRQVLDLGQELATLTDDSSASGSSSTGDVRYQLVAFAALHSQQGH